jgi:hypothetical protein
MELCSGEGTRGRDLRPRDKDGRVLLQSRSTEAAEGPGRGRGGLRLGVRDSVCPVAAKGMDGSGPRQNFATVEHATRYEVFLPGPHRDPLSVDDQGITALHHDHVFVIGVDVCRGCSRFTAGPKRHLTPVRSIEHVTFDARSGLVGCRDPVRRMSHEFGEIVHGRKSLGVQQGRLGRLGGRRHGPDVGVNVGEFGVGDYLRGIRRHRPPRMPNVGD